MRAVCKCLLKLLEAAAEGKVVVISGKWQVASGKEMQPVPVAVGGAVAAAVAEAIAMCCTLRIRNVRKQRLQSVPQSGRWQLEGRGGCGRVCEECVWSARGVCLWSAKEPYLHMFPLANSIFHAAVVAAFAAAAAVVVVRAEFCIERVREHIAECAVRVCASVSVCACAYLCVFVCIADDVASSANSSSGGSSSNKAFAHCAFTLCVRVLPLPLPPPPLLLLHSCCCACPSRVRERDREGEKGRREQSLQCCNCGAASAKLFDATCVCGGVGQVSVCVSTSVCVSLCVCECVLSAKFCCSRCHCSIFM